ncbi:MAG: CinA family protein, partial [Kiloniellaceae bacterium]
IPGASEVMERGFIAYADAAKTELLGVPAALIGRAGAVSAEVAAAMAGGALGHSAADAAVSVTGIAGPGGATADKPVGLVFLGAARRGAAPLHERHLFSGDRSAIRLAAVAAALDLLGRMIGAPR